MDSLFEYPTDQATTQRPSRNSSIFQDETWRRDTLALGPHVASCQWRPREQNCQETASPSSLFSQPRTALTLLLTPPCVTLREWTSPPSTGGGDSARRVGAEPVHGRPLRCQTEPTMDGGGSEPPTRAVTGSSRVNPPGDTENSKCRSALPGHYGNILARVEGQSVFSLAVCELDSRP